MDEKSEVIEMTADIVSAYVGNNSVAAADLPNLIQSVHRALAGISTGSDVQEVAPKEPAVPVRRSITLIIWSVWKTAGSSSRSSATCAPSTT